MRNHHGYSDTIGRKARAGILISSIAFIAVGMTLPAAAATPMSGAEKLHRLDVLLKVADQRCRRSDDAFHGDYTAFARSHRHALVRAERELGRELAERYGTVGAGQALTQANASFAREYAARDSRLTCHDFKVLTQGLAVVVGSATLLEAADQILPEDAAAQMTFTRG